VVTEGNLTDYDQDRQARTEALKKQFADELLSCN